jgi:hypothetical protein
VIFHINYLKKVAVFTSKLKGAPCRAAVNKAVASKVNVLSAIKSAFEELSKPETEQVDSQMPAFNP